MRKKQISGSQAAVPQSGFPGNTRPPESLPRGLGLSWQISLEKTLCAPGRFTSTGANLKSHTIDRSRDIRLTFDVSPTYLPTDPLFQVLPLASGRPRVLRSPERNARPGRPLLNKVRSASPSGSSKGPASDLEPPEQRERHLQMPNPKTFPENSRMPHSTCKCKCIQVYHVYIILVSTLMYDKHKQVNKSPSGFPAALLCTPGHVAGGICPVKHKTLPEGRPMASL